MDEDQAIEVIKDSTKAAGQVARRMDALERQFGALEATLNERMQRLETEMGSMNAHLDNLVRSAEITNGLLQKQVEQKAEEMALQAKAAEDAKKAKADADLRTQNDAKENRDLAKSAGKELWGVFKAPVGFLVTAVAAWIAYHALGIKLATILDGQPTPTTHSAPPSATP